ncbi:MAG: quinolinate synthase NadA [Elusimicrobiaceae bacterium]|nr:quinolinate synthase NadA [Elusimicrobiaceae bacterium]
MLSTLAKEAAVMGEAQRLFGVLHSVSKTKAEKWTLEDCLAAAAYTLAINRFKKEQNAVILAHSYTTPDLVYGVADFRGDSYELALKARESEAEKIIFAGVWFMAETAKIINPAKQVIIPAGKAGCTLADSMTAQQVRDLRAKHPGVPALCYINGSAEVKAVCDVCVTSGNVFDIAQKMPGDELIFVPDMLMAENLENELKRRQTPKKIISSGGSCCVASSPDKTVGMLTERGLVNRLEAEYPDKQFVWPFGVCSYMKKNTLINTLEALVDPRAEQVVEVDTLVAQQARKAIDNMFELTK